MVELRCADAAELAEAIRSLAVRGAPAIGVAAAYGLALAATQGRDVDEAYEVLAASRPTAVNLRWALDEMRPDPTPERARRIHEDEVARCVAMGAHAAALVPPAARILTHCNAGGLATGGYGSAVGAIRAAAERGGVTHVWVDETRPLLQGARLTAFELEALGIPHAVIVDSAAASRMAAGRGRHRDHGRRPHRRERRHREQDRHLRSRRARPPPRDPVRDRGTDLDDRPGDARPEPRSRSRSATERR